MTTWGFEVPGKNVFFRGRILVWGMAYQLKAGFSQKDVKGLNYQID
jgi:hypothetical protein